MSNKNILIAISMLPIVCLTGPALSSSAAGVLYDKYYIISYAPISVFDIISQSVYFIEREYVKHLAYEYGAVILSSSIAVIKLASDYIIDRVRTVEVRTVESVKRRRKDEELKDDDFVIV